MSLHINRFIDRIKSSDLRSQRDFTMSMSDAKDLHADITKLLLALQVLQEQRTNTSTVVTDTNIEVDGGTF
jgi:hypothetical protein